MNALEHAAHREQLQASPAYQEALENLFRSEDNLFAAGIDREEMGNYAAKSLSPYAVDQLPAWSYRTSDLTVRECAICTCAFQEGERLIRLPCSDEHCFHRDCIADWLMKQGTCPLCRARQPIAYGVPGSPPVRVVPLRLPLSTAYDRLGVPPPPTGAGL